MCGVHSAIGDRGREPLAEPGEHGVAVVVSERVVVLLEAVRVVDREHVLRRR